MATIKDDSFKTEVLTRLAKIETKLDDYNNIKQKTDVAFTQSKDNEKELEEIKDKIKYISRTIVTAIIAGVIGLVFVYIKMGLKV